jgi:bacteriocin biosynthesis cyclodehydratase domain-containing protein
VKPWLRCASGAGRVAFEYGHRAVVLEGSAAERLLPALLPLLDGTRTVADVVGVLGEAAAPAVERALGLLDTHGLLDAGGEDAGETARFLAAVSASGLGEGECAVRLAAATVVVAGRSRTAHELAELLVDADVGEVSLVELADGPPEPPVALAVAAPRASELPCLAEWNRAALRTRQPWLQVLPHDGRIVAVGPLFLPGETACHTCFTLRRAANSGYADELAFLEDVPAPYPSTPPLERGAAGLAAALALRWLADGDPALAGTMAALELAGPALTRHEVLRVPRCPDCSPARATPAPAPWHEEAA